MKQENTRRQGITHTLPGVTTNTPCTTLGKRPRRISKITARQYRPTHSLEGGAPAPPFFFVSFVESRDWLSSLRFTMTSVLTSPPIAHGHLVPSRLTSHPYPCSVRSSARQHAPGCVLWVSQATTGQKFQSAEVGACGYITRPKKGQPHGTPAVCCRSAKPESFLWARKSGDGDEHRSKSPRIVPKHRVLSFRSQLKRLLSVIPTPHFLWVHPPSTVA